MPKSKGNRSIYGIHPSVQMIANWIAGLKEKTGRTLEEWAAYARTDGPDNEKDGRAWFKEHGHGGNMAWWLAEYVWKTGWIDGDAKTYLAQAQVYVRDMYSGPKEHLKPIHDAILDLAAELGEDVKACPCKTIVPLYRQHVFAEIKPTTRTRIDLSFALRKHKGRIPKRLLDTKKPPTDRLSHRIPIADVHELDDEVKHWLQVAYDLDG